MDDVHPDRSNIGGLPCPHWPHCPHRCHTSRHFFCLVTLLGGVASCCTRRYSGEIWGAIQPRVLSQAACLKRGGEVWLHDWSVCKSCYTLWAHLKYFQQKSVYNMLKSVSKVCKSYFVLTLGVLLIMVITKCKTENISVYKVGKSADMVLKSTPKVCTRF